MYILTNLGIILRTADGAYIPTDVGNRDYIVYLDWIAAGNTPDLADSVNPNAPILAQIAELESQITSRRLREALLSGGMSFIAGLDTQIAQLRRQLS